MSPVVTNPDCSIMAEQWQQRTSNIQHFHPVITDLNNSNFSSHFKYSTCHPTANSICATYTYKINIQKQYHSTGNQFACWSGRVSLTWTKWHFLVKVSQKNHCMKCHVWDTWGILKHLPGSMDRSTIYILKNFKLLFMYRQTGSQSFGMARSHTVQQICIEFNPGGQLHSTNRHLRNPALLSYGNIFGLKSKCF